MALPDEPMEDSASLRTVVYLEGRPCSLIIDPVGSSASSAMNAQSGKGDDDKKRGGDRYAAYFGSSVLM